MYRTFLSLLVLAAASPPAAAADRDFSVVDFDRLVVEGPYIVELSAGRSTSAKATGPREALDQLILEVNGQTLRIRRNRTAERGRQTGQSGPVTISLTSRTLRSAVLIGPGSLQVDRAEGLRVELAVQGSGRLRASQVVADQLSLGLRGSGQIIVSGSAKTLRATVEGSGDLDGSGLRSESANLVTNSSGDISLAVNREVDVSAQGLGNVVISGRPSCNVAGPGASQVSCGSNQR